jgi:hypothetical protein
MPVGGIGRKHFRLEKQVALIQGHGVVCVIYPCLQCPCLLEDHQFNPNCTTCKGTGRFYPPNASYSTTLLMHQEDSRREYNEPGTWLSGSIRASILPGVRLCERDLVLLMDIRDTYTDEVLIRALDDQVRFTHGVVLEMVADRDTVYRPGIDYVFTPPNTVAWIPGGHAPPYGMQYSVKYSAYPEFLVVNDSPRLRVEHRIPQSQEVLLMRVDKLRKDF